MDTDKCNVKWEWEELEAVDSTNRVALERVLARWREGRSAAGIVVTARQQTSGRGQHGRRWESPAGGLYMSAVLEDVPAELRPRLALVVGAVVTEALAGLGAQGLMLRWPNDLVVKEGAGQWKKLAGILCEAVAQGDQWAAIIGIGVNVACVDLPAQFPATSLEARGVRVGAHAVAGALLPHLAAVPAMRLGDAVAQVRPRDALLGQRVRLNDGAQVWEGIGAGIDDSGRLLLTLDDAGEKAFDRGTLMVPPASSSPL